MPSVAQKSPYRDDYDSYQPCFFESEAEEEFYQDVPIPGNDIWKKFELLPTPPRSPRRDNDDEFVGENLQDPTMEQLVQVSDILDCVELQHLCQTGKDNGNKCIKCSQTIKLNLIQDCMWSTTWSCKVKNNLEHNGNACAASTKLKDCEDKSRNSKDTESEKKEIRSSIRDSLRRTCRSRCDSVNIDVPNVSTQCVDPTAVFPLAISCDSKKKNSRGTETPSDSEEEIDVVSIGEKKQQQQQQVHSRLTASPQLQHHLQVTSPCSIFRKKKISMLKSSENVVNATVAAMHNYTQPTSAEPSPTKLNIVLSRSTECSDHGVKRTLSDDNIPFKKFKRSSHRLRMACADSRSSSDSEDCVGKRSQHNDMERKRRIDLKHSFLELRDHVPELHKQERAPKVTILRKASEYIYQLRNNETALLLELRKQKERKTELAQKLSNLRRSTWF